MEGFPVLMHTALDATDCRALAEFYRVFLGLRYRPGDEVPASGDDADWLVLLDGNGRRVIAVNQVQTLVRPTWPTDEIPKQMHHDFRGDRRFPDLAAHTVRSEVFSSAHRMCIPCRSPPARPVSYTHLTLPTSDLV